MREPDSSSTGRTGLGLAGVAGVVVVAALNAYAALVADSRACGDEMHAPPSANSPLAGYCELFGDPDARRVLFKAILVYAPVWIVACGTIASVLSRRWRTLAIAIVLAAGVLVVMIVLAFALPAE